MKFHPPFVVQIILALNFDIIPIRIPLQIPIPNPNPIPPAVANANALSLTKDINYFGGIMKNG